MISRVIGLVLVVLLFAVSLVSAADPGHSAGAISAGTFEAGDFIVNGNLTSIGNLSSGDFFVDTNLGRVGIGTAAPLNELEVRGGVNVTGDIYLNGTAINQWLYNQTDSPYFYNQTAAVSLATAFESNGNVINNLTAAALNISGNFTVGNVGRIGIGVENLSSAQLVIQPQSDTDLPLRITGDADGYSGAHTLSEYKYGPTSSTYTTFSDLSGAFAIGSGTDVDVLNVWYGGAAANRVTIGNSGPDNNQGKLAIFPGGVSGATIGLAVANGYNAAKFYVYDDGRIWTDGNVSIGTSSEYSNNLNVNGTANFTGEIYVNGGTAVSEWLYNQTASPLFYNQTDTIFFYNQTASPYFYNQTVTQAITNLFNQDLNVTDDVIFNSIEIQHGGHISNNYSRINSEVFGKNAESYGVNELVVGFDASALGNAGMAIGAFSNASATSGEDIAIGYSSKTLGRRAIAIGYQAFANNNNAGIAIGYLANNSGDNSVALGQSAFASGGNSFALGTSSEAGTDSVAVGGIANASFQRSIAIGRAATTTAIRQLVIGGNTASASYIENTYIGGGVTDTAPRSNIFHGTGGSGTDIYGADVTLAGGKGTGAGIPGSLIFQTSTIAGSSSTLQSLATRFIVNGSTGNVGIGTASPSNTLDVRGDGNFSGDIYFANGTKVTAGGATSNIFDQDLNISSNVSFHNVTLSGELIISGNTSDVTDANNTQGAELLIKSVGQGSWEIGAGVGGIAAAVEDGGYIGARIDAIHAIGSGQGTPDIGWSFRTSNNGNLVEDLRIEPSSTPGHRGNLWLTNSTLSFGGSNGKYARIERGDGSDANFIFNSRVTGSGDFEFQNGNVGIGTSSPQFTLDVNGAGNFTGDIYLNGTAINQWLYNQTVTQAITNLFDQGLNSTDAVTFHNLTLTNEIFTGGNASLNHTLYVKNGRVGIGTASPSSLLHIDSGASGDAVFILESDNGQGDPYINFELGAGGSSYTFGIDDDNTNYLVLSASDTLGTSNIAVFETGGDVAFTGELEANKFVVGTKGDSEATQLDIWVTDNNTPLRIINDNNGNNLMFEVDRDPTSGATSDPIVRIYDDDANENIRLHSDSDSYFNGGNVGIGTASPAALLHVNGAAQFESNVTLINQSSLVFNNTDTYITSNTTSCIIIKGLTSSLEIC